MRCIGCKYGRSYTSFNKSMDSRLVIRDGPFSFFQQLYDRSGKDTKLLRKTHQPYAG